MDGIYRRRKCKERSLKIMQNTNQNYTYDNCKPTTVMVQGTTVYSRVASFVEGEELRKANQRSQYPKDNPYTTITVDNPVIIPVNPNGLTYEEACVQSKFSNGKCYAHNSSRNLPWIGVRREDAPNVVDQIKPEGELATDLNVTLVLRIFPAKRGRRGGCSLDGVIVNEPIRYYNGAAAVDSLKAYGITLNTLPNEPQVINPDVMGDGNDGFEQAPVQAPFATAPAYQQPAPAYQAPAPYPAQQPNYQAPAQPGGIRYNPADDRSY